MFTLIEIVIPKIMDNWDDIAYALGHDADEIQKKERDQRKCCKNLFADWLKADDASAKTWATLLEAIKKVDTIHKTTVAEDIRKELKNK